MESGAFNQLQDRYDEGIAGVLSRYDHIVITGALPTVCHAEGITRFVYAHEIRIFDSPEFASISATLAARTGTWRPVLRCGSPTNARRGTRRSSD
jgi:menaquinone-dependent protoporphyrinogen IX oxidase